MALLKLETAVQHVREAGKWCREWVVVVFVL